MPKLDDVWKFLYDIQGIFYYMNDELSDGEGESPEWLADNVEWLDAEYHLNHSGNKQVCPMIISLLEVASDDELPELAKRFLANMAYAKFKGNWNRLWNLYMAEYDPLENYYLDETETPDITRTHSGSITHSVSDDYKINAKVTTETDISVSTEGQNDSGTYGFQNSSPVPTGLDASTSETHTTADPEHNITDTETTQEGETVDDHDFTDTETGTRGLIRRGQIGILTYRQMIEGEIELWKWNFYDSVMRDIDSLLTLSVYEYNKYER